MLLMLLIYTVKKRLKKRGVSDFRVLIKSQLWKVWFVLPFLLVSFTNLNDEEVKAEILSFSIINKNSIVGNVDIQKETAANTTIYKVASEVNTRVIFNFNAISTEKSIYHADTLVYSSIFRKLNRKVKLDQCLTFKNGQYRLRCRKGNELLDIELINRNLVTLFFYEPKGIQEIYSDKYNRMVKITPIGDGVYKIKLPNKSTNIYHYENGKCIRIDAASSFYKVKLVSKSKGK